MRLDAIGFPISPTLAVTLADQLGLAGFGLACISLIWQGTTWFLGNRVRLKVRLFRPKWNRENLVVECVNTSHQRTVQVRQVWIQWGKERADGVELAADWWHPREGGLGPGLIFQAKADISGLQAHGMPPLPVKVWGVLRVGARSRPYRGRPVRLESVESETPRT